MRSSVALNEALFRSRFVFRATLLTIHLESVAAVLLCVPKGPSRKHCLTQLCFFVFTVEGRIPKFAAERLGDVHHCCIRGNSRTSDSEISRVERHTTFHVFVHSLHPKVFVNASSNADSFQELNFQRSPIHASTRVFPLYPEFPNRVTGHPQRQG